MRLAARVRKLERQRGGACWVCGGLGRLEIVFENPDGNIPEAEGCRACGGVLKLIILEADPEEHNTQAAG